MYVQDRFDVECTSTIEPSLDGLKDWLKTKPADESYDFLDCRGACLMGQYMSHCGIDWLAKTDTYCAYKHTLDKVFGGGLEGNRILSKAPWTFGGALKRVEAFEQEFA